MVAPKFCINDSPVTFTLLLACHVITEGTDVEKGGFFKYSLGNDGNRKYGVKLSTGESKKGFSATAYVDRNTGDGFVDGTPFESISYFGSISKDFGNNHKLSLTAFGGS